MDGEPCGSHHGCAASAALVLGQLNENSLRDSSMGSRLIRVHRALAAPRSRPQPAQSIFSLDAAFQILVTEQQPQVAPQLPTGGDVSYASDAVGSAPFGDAGRDEDFTAATDSKAAPKSGLCKGYLWLLGAILIEPIISRKMAIS